MVGIEKIAAHRQRLAAYVRGERIFPVTVELNLTAKCNRSCPDCPSYLGEPTMSLDMDFVERLLEPLAGHCRGMIVTGGEPTLSAAFPDVLRLARTQFGFEDIAVVTNGSRLGDDAVAEALVRYASAVRISLYDWSPESLTGLESTLQRIALLRQQTERADSSLLIGTSALTSGIRQTALRELPRAVRDAGAHWLYFHPTCVRDVDSGTSRLDQAKVQEAVTECGRQESSTFRVLVLEDRYSEMPLAFDGYHTAHFSLVIGADQKNYLATEVRYQPEYLLADLAEGWSKKILWQPERLDRIGRVASSSYPAKGSRNRGVLYNTLIEQLRTGQQGLDDVCARIPAGGFLLPHII